MDLAWFSAFACARPATSAAPPPIIRPPAVPAAAGGSAASFRSAGKQSGAKRPKPETPAAGEEAASSKLRGTRIGREASDRKLMEDATLNATLCGDCTQPSTGTVTPHPASACKHPLQNGQACWHNLWLDRDELRNERSKFLQLTQEERSTFVFHALQSSHYAMEDPDGNTTGKAHWHYFLGGREVCRHTYLLAYPISERTLENLQH
eukprot:4049637-Prymnesium_polylepis.1